MSNSLSNGSGTFCASGTADLNGAKEGSTETDISSDSVMFTQHQSVAEQGDDISPEPPENSRAESPSSTLGAAAISLPEDHCSQTLGGSPESHHDTPERTENSRAESPPSNPGAITASAGSECEYSATKLSLSKEVPSSLLQSSTIRVPNLDAYDGPPIFSLGDHQSQTFGGSPESHHDTPTLNSRQEKPASQGATPTAGPQKNSAQTTPYPFTGPPEGQRKSSEGATPYLFTEPPEDQRKSSEGATPYSFTGPPEDQRKSSEGATPYSFIGPPQGQSSPEASPHHFTESLQRQRSSPPRSPGSRQEEKSSGSEPASPSRRLSLSACPLNSINQSVNATATHSTSDGPSAQVSGHITTPTSNPPNLHLHQQQPPQHNVHMQQQPPQHIVRVQQQPPRQNIHVHRQQDLDPETGQPRGQ